MPVGNQVIMSPGTQGDAATYAPGGGPLVGEIVADDGTIADVIWENGKRTDGLVRDSVLRQIQFADEEDGPLVGNLGKFVQMAGFPAVGTPDSVPKSPAAAGVVHRAFLVLPDFSGEGDPILAFVVMSWQNGLVQVCVPSPSTLLDPAISALREILVEQPGRRLVGFG